MVLEVVEALVSAAGKDPVISPIRVVYRLHASHRNWKNLLKCT